MTEATGEKKSTSWVDRWKARWALAAQDRAHRLAEKGDWDYIPKGWVIVPRWLLVVSFVVPLLNLVVTIWFAGPAR